MSTIANLPASAKLMTGSGNAWEGSQDQSSREESFSWYVPWEDSDAFYAAVVGTQQSVSYGGGVSVTRRIPLQHPYNPNLWASKLTWNGQDGPYKAAGVPFKFIKFRVSFGQPGYSIGGDGSQENSDNSSGFPPFCKISKKQSTRTVTDVGNKYTFSTGGNSQYTLKHDIGVRFGSSTYEMTLFAVLDLTAWETVTASLEGMVNSQPMKVGSFNRKAGTVLFDGSGYDYDQDCAGNAQWTCHGTLMCSSLPWNSYFIGGKIVTLSPLPYQPADLNQLFI